MSYRAFHFLDGAELQAGTLYCIGRNYAAHAKEMNAVVPSEPLVFLKGPNALRLSGEELRIPSFSQSMHHEVELVVVMGKDADNVSTEEALDYVAGYAVGLDLTLRDRQSEAKQRGEPWALSKAFKGSAPVSDVVPVSEVEDPSILELRLEVNSELRQQGKVLHMERSVAQLISYLSIVFGLRKGDAIFTGTPEGVGALKAGDVVNASLSNYTQLRCIIAS